MMIEGELKNYLVLTQADVDEYLAGLAVLDRTEDPRVESDLNLLLDARREVS